MILLFKEISSFKEIPTLNDRDSYIDKFSRDLNFQIKNEGDLSIILAFLFPNQSPANKKYIATIVKYGPYAKKSLRDFKPVKSMIAEKIPPKNIP